MPGEIASNIRRPVSYNQQLVLACLSSKTLVKSLREYEMLRFYAIFGLC